MKPMILGMAGKIASGKSTLSKEIATFLGWQWVSFGDYVRTIAQQQGLGDSRAVLQMVGESLLKAGMTDFCQSVLAQSNWKPGQPLIVDGIRHSEIIPILRDLVVPLELRLVFVKVDEPIREERLVTRGLTNYEKLQQIERHSTEIQVKTVLPEMADLIVDGNRSIDFIVKDIVSWMERLN